MSYLHRMLGVCKIPPRRKKKTRESKANTSKSLAVVGLK